MHIEKLTKEKNKLLNDIKLIDDKLAILPQGHLIYSHNNGHPKFYVSINNKKIYLKQSQKLLISQYLTKRYLILLKKELSQEIKAINAYLKHCNVNSKSTELIHSFPEYTEMISSIFKTIDNKTIIDSKKWLDEPFESNPFHPEGLIYKGHSGNTLRSKSECIIDMCLHINGIPFKYECALYFNNIVFYPDFTILNPKNNKIIYWEHLGQLDNAEYQEKTLNKLKIYAKNGIYPGINLILTSETSFTPLDISYVENLIKYYFK